MKNLILVGGNRLNEDEPLNTIIDLAKKKNYRIFLYTEKVHLEKKCKNTSFRVFLKKKKIEHIKVDNINSQLQSIKKKVDIRANNLMLLTNSIWKINKNLINLFKNKIFNIHIGKFPFQIGAGGASWLKLVGAKLSSITIHEVTEEYDEGKVLLEKDFKLSANFSLLSYYSSVRKNEKLAYKLFFNIVEKKHRLKLKNKKDKVYMPRLNTKIHGFIDWSWDAKEIVNFINAFSDPYQGATTFIKKKKFLLKNAKFKRSKLKFHPFQSGIIFNKNSNGLNIAAKNGCIQVNNISDSNGKKIDLNSIKTGSRFFTSAYYLDQARSTSSFHSSKGIINKN
jgi:methionyl-tRNA formyltransferase